MLVEDSDAFSVISADRATSVGVTSDENALLGLDVVSEVEKAKSGQSLVSVSNNADVELSVSMLLHDPAQGSISPEGTTLDIGASDSFSVSVASNGPTGTNALPFLITATDNETLTISMTRRVDVVSTPSLNQSITDKTKNGSVSYEVIYQVTNFDNFGSIDITFDNRNPNKSWVETKTETSTQREGVITYQEDGAHESDYEITFEVFDDNSEPNRIIEKTVIDYADGDDPSENDDISGGENDPLLESFTVTDSTQNNRTYFTIDYEVSNIENFQHVRVTFDNTNPNKDWSDKNETNSSAPSGTVAYQAGDTEDDTYEITVKTINQNGIATDSGTVTVLAGSSGTTTYS